MTLKYESELLFDLMKRDGDDTPSDVLPYESELKEKYLNQVEGAYPKLQDYRPEWLYYNLYYLIPSDFPDESVANVTSAIFYDVVPYAYRSAILKGQTLVSIYDGYSDDNQSSTELFFKISQDLKENTKYMIISYDYQFLSGGYRNVDWEDIIQTSNTLTNKFIFTTKSPVNFKHGYLRGTTQLTLEEKQNAKIVVVEYQDGMENWDIPYFEGMQSVKLPVLTTSNGDGTKTNILTVNEDVTLRSNGDVYDELNLLTGRLTQRIGENNEVLAQAVVKTVDLSCINEQGKNVTFRPIEGTMHVNTSSQALPPLLDMSVPVEATTQNITSFANIVEEE